MSYFLMTLAERRLIPASGMRGPVPVLIAIMMFVMVIVAATGLALANMATVVRSGVEHRYSIQIADGAGQAPAALAAARAAPGVATVGQVPPDDLRRTLERWLGPAGAAADLPLPVIIDVALKPGAGPAPVARAVTAAVPSARFIAYRASLSPLLGALQGMTLLAFGIVLLTGLATAAAVVLAARGALNTHRATIDVMHGIGATDDQVARLFQRQIAIDSLLGGLAGAAVAGIVLAMVLGGAGLATTLAGVPPLSLSDALILAAFPLAGAGLATFVARRAVLDSLRSSL